uniref:Subtilisin-like protease SBT4.3 n=1 Tax=Vitis vinifera TaxID=29760 RepID=F6GUX0_VITVI
MTSKSPVESGTLVWSDGTQTVRIALPIIQVYVVYLGHLPENQAYSPMGQQYSILGSVLETSSISQAFVRSYRKSFNGFAARLTDREKERLANMEDVVSIFPSKTLQPQTSRSWDFMGFTESIRRRPFVESDVIIGVFDTGIWPESESFSDKGFGPIPRKWRGVCQGGKNFTCNNKLIGARNYNAKKAPDNYVRDIDGHGTHTASTAAGNPVTASFFGVAKGTARGGVPSARIAAYKVCHPSGCEEADIMAAFDDAIADGVDIITISLGLGGAVDFTIDSIAIGAFHAMQKGILTVNSAGNNGPKRATAVGVAPWLLSVAASSTDRRIISKVILGDGTRLTGAAINSFQLRGEKFPLVYGKDATSKCDAFSAQCISKCLDSKLVKGKIVVCQAFWGLQEAFKAGAVGAILLNDFQTDVSFIVPLPASALRPKRFNKLLSYINSTKSPEATILRSVSRKDASAPVVAQFSSRGPNIILPEILKPDISAPGVDILAAFSPLASPSEISGDKRAARYNIISGTSMACPHVAGVAAYVKTFHPNWSPSAIQSALMTTAWRMNATRTPDGELAYGSGHVNPVKAISPGLIYHAHKQDYVNMLCGMGYDSKNMRLITGENSQCPKNSTFSAKDLNYPSMAVKVPPNKPFKVEFPRRVKNVGPAPSIYKAEVTTTSPRLKVRVIPNVLSFRSLYEEKHFVVSVVGKGLELMESASLVWSDGRHLVKSPIVVYTDNDLPSD